MCRSSHIRRLHEQIDVRENERIPEQGQIRGECGSPLQDEYFNAFASEASNDPFKALLQERVSRDVPAISVFQFAGQAAAEQASEPSPAEVPKQQGRKMRVAIIEIVVEVADLYPS